jgi:hypothetical protein
VSGATSTWKSARFLLPEYITREEENVVLCPVYSGAALVAPDSGTCEITDDAGEVIATPAVTVVGDVAQATISASDLPETLAFSVSWRVRWVLTFGATTERYANSAHLVRSQLTPVLTDQDLFNRVEGLDPANSGAMTSRADFQKFRDEAWAQLMARVSGEGALPYLIMEPTALREVHMLATLRLIFDSFSASGNEHFQARAEDYGERYEQAYSRLRFRYDTDQDGRSESRRKRPARSSLWLC